MERLISYIKNISTSENDVFKLPDDIKLPLLKAVRDYKQQQQEFQTHEKSILDELDLSQQASIIESINSRRTLLSALDDIIRSLFRAEVSRDQINTLLEIFPISLMPTALDVQLANVNVNLPWNTVLDSSQEDSTSIKNMAPVINGSSENVNNTPAVVLKEHEPAVMPVVKGETARSRWKRFLCCCYCDKEGASDQPPKTDVGINNPTDALRPVAIKDEIQKSE